MRSSLNRPAGIDRRRALALFSSALTSPKLAIASEDHAGDTFYAACRREVDGAFSAAVFDTRGQDVARIVLPARGHDFAVRPDRGDGSHVVAFARRPGDFAVAFHAAAPSRPPVWFRAPSGRHFYGHGAFSGDGRLLYTTENGFDTAHGLIGIYDATNAYAPVGAFSSGGIGPHDLAMLPDGQTLVVANGGIETHPDFGRTPLNLASMSPSIAFIDMATGDLINKVQLPPDLHQLSLRHMAVTTDGLIVIGGQHNGPSTDRPELIYTLRPGEELRALTLPIGMLHRLRNYITSVAVLPDGTHAAITSAKGNAICIIDLAARAPSHFRAIPDAAGVAASDEAFVFTSGTGQIASLMEETLSSRSTATHWDNHLRVVPWMP